MSRTKSNELLFAEILKIIREADANTNKVLSKLTDDEVLKKMFVNFRGSTTKRQGLRLTASGYDMMSKSFSQIVSQMEKGQSLSMRNLLDLEHASKFPYYIDQSKNRIITFDMELGTMLRLSDCDFDMISGLL